MTLRYRHLIPLFILVLTAVAAPALADLMSDERQIDAAARAALVNAVQTRSNDASADFLTSNPDGVLTSDIAVDTEWAFGMLVVRAPEGIHAGPELRLFMARRNGLNWDVALEYTPEFYDWVSQAPALMGVGPRMHLLSSSLASIEARGANAAPAPTLLDLPEAPTDTPPALSLPDATGSDFAAPDIVLPEVAQTAGEAATEPQAFTTQGFADAKLSLPWRTGESWRLGGGPHGNGGNSLRPWSALDFTADNEPVRAARDGFVWRSSSCPNFVRVDHSDGWQTGYYHLINEQVINGQYVQRGQHLGNTSARVGCGGWASGPHVHFTVRLNGAFQNINGYDIGGWTVREGSAAYRGCMQRVRDNVSMCVPDFVRNEGAVGSGVIRDRYDYNRDGFPDLWAVDTRDSTNDATSLHIASGEDFGRAIQSGPVKLPMQPLELNSAFGAGDFNNDNVPDLYVFHRRDSSGTTALRVMDGVSPGWLLQDTTTALPPNDDSVAFLVADYNLDAKPDLWAVTPRSPWNNVTLKIASGTAPNTLLVDTTVNIPSPSPYDDMIFAAADFNFDGTVDLWAITPRAYHLTGPAVRIIDGRDWQTVLRETGTGLNFPTTNADSYSFIVEDFNRDDIPDLWLMEQRSGQVDIVSGVDFQSRLASDVSWLTRSHKARWRIIGTDRSREAVAPAVPVPKRPRTMELITDLNYEFRWEGAGLAKFYRLHLVNAAGQTVLNAAVRDLTTYCWGINCRINTSELGFTLRDGETYTWFVEARNRHGSTFSERVSFVTDVPGAPILHAPAVGQQLDAQPVFYWEGTPLSGRYKLIVRSTDLTFRVVGKLPANACTGTHCFVMLVDPLPAGEYEWRVVAREDVVGGKSRSTWQRFSMTITELPTPEPNPVTGTRTDQPTIRVVPPPAAMPLD